MKKAGVSNQELKEYGRNVAKLHYQFGGSARPSKDEKGEKKGGRKK